jgi:oligoendopeptidase F
MTTTPTIPVRSAVPREFTWDLESLFATTEDWETEFQRVSAALGEFDRFRGHLADGSAVLLDFFETYERVLRPLGIVAQYGRLGAEGDTTDAPAAARRGRVQGLMARAASALAFHEPELMALGFATLRAWRQTEPRLELYAHYFDMLERNQAHVRSVEVEELLGALSEPFGTVGQIAVALSDADLAFRPAQDSRAAPLEVVQGSYKSLILHPDREVRRSAWESYQDAFRGVQHGLANTLAAATRQHVFVARTRRYHSSLEAALGAKFIPVEVFHRLIDVFRRNLPTWHRYWRLRKRVLGVDTLREYDLRAPIGPGEPRVPFEQAMEWICAGMQPLGDDYVATMRRGVLEERWVDRYPNRGKRSGAFSSGAPGTHPFVLMSYSDDISSLSTLAHELGHSMHSYYSTRAQPLVYARYGSFLAEVASNFNQALVRAYLLRTQAAREFQIALIEEAMGNFQRYFFLMPTLARFELAIHERAERGAGLTAREMSTLLAGLFREGYGDEVAMDEERTGITWAQFPIHLYANFYVYEYATGISAAQALAAPIVAGDAEAAERYRAFLRSGRSRYPLDTLRAAGVDMTTPEPVESAFATLAGLVERLETLLGAAG